MDYSQSQPEGGVGQTTKLPIPTVLDHQKGTIGRIIRALDSLEGALRPVLTEVPATLEKVQEPQPDRLPKLAHWIEENTQRLEKIADKLVSLKDRLEV